MLAVLTAVLVFALTCSVAVVGATAAGAAPAATAAPAAPRVMAGDQPDTLPAPSAPPDEVRQTADDVLARPEFQRPEPSLIEKAQNWLSDRVGRVLQSLTTGSGASLIGWGVMLAAIAVLLLRFSRTVQSDPRRSAEISVERTRTADAWDAEAERLEADGEWKLALRCRFRALVTALVERGQVDDVPGRTAGEYRAEVSDTLPEVAPQFAAATGLFEDAWYGDRHTGEDENRRFRALSGEVRRASAATRRSRSTEVAVAEAVPA